jgi:GTPase SAR1 family protein
MKAFQVLVHSISNESVCESKKIHASESMPFNEFRKKCSELMSFDVISIFSRERNRLTDMSEIEIEREVFVFDGFYPTKSGGSTTISLLSERGTEDLENKKSRNSEKNKIWLRVETVGTLKAGKSSLIWRFVKSDLPTGEISSITEVVFEKKIDIGCMTVHFSINDLRECDDAGIFEDRVVDKEILMVCVPKSELTNNKDYLNWVFRRTHKLNPGALLVLVVTKCDLNLGERIYGDIESLQKIDVLIVNSSIFDCMSADIKSPEEVFTIVAEEYIWRSKGNPRRSKYASKEFKKFEKTEAISRISWLLQPFRSLKYCFGRRA